MGRSNELGLRQRENHLNRVNRPSPYSRWHVIESIWLTTRGRPHLRVPQGLINSFLRFNNLRLPFQGKRLWRAYLSLALWACLLSVEKSGDFYAKLAQRHTSDRGQAGSDSERAHSDTGISKIRRCCGTLHPIWVGIRGSSSNPSPIHCHMARLCAKRRWRTNCAS